MSTDAQVAWSGRDAARPAVASAKAAPFLRVEDVQVERGSRKLLREATLEARSGEFLAVVGPNGAGKSTLLRAISGEWSCSGRIELFGAARGAWRRDLLARRMACMPQSSSLSFGFTVAELIALGRLPHAGAGSRNDRRVVNEVIDLLNLASLQHRTYTTLSGGERQRAQFGRVLAQIWEEPEHSLLLLDEPTSALDLAQQTALLSIARQRSRVGTCVIAVMHDLNLAARYATRVIALVDGRLVGDGSSRELLTADFVESVFGVAADVELAACDGAPIILVRDTSAHGRTPPATSPGDANPKPGQT